MESIAFSWKCVKWYWPCFLLIASGIVWFVFFMKAIQRRRNLKETDKKTILNILIVMYLLQCIVLWLYGYSFLYYLLGINIDKYFILVRNFMFVNWLVWLVNMVTLVAVIPREYKTLRWAGLEVFFCQLFVYGIAFAHFGHY